MYTMFTITRKTTLNSEVTRIEILAPRVAAKAKPGQFVILRSHESGERIPLTIAHADREAGTITLIYQKVGHSTFELDDIPEGSAVKDLAGPLGKPTELNGIHRAAVVGGGLGCAIAWPVAQALRENGAHVDMIAGFRTKDLIILEQELLRDSTKLHICTDDGSYGRRGFVTDALAELLDSSHYDEVFAIGPVIMMKFVSRIAAERKVPVTVSLNPLMVDGTGMCGCCRVTVGGEVKFACVDGPDFDGAAVDFDELTRRNSAYKEFEAAKREAHICRLTGDVRA